MVVGSVFLLIFLGGLVTTWGAGMAVPDWPLSNGSLNPNGWWNDFPTRLEHGHRLTASLVGVLTLFLTGWVWRNRWIRGAAVVIALGLVYSFLAGPQHASQTPAHIMHASLWVGAFIAIIVALVSWVLLKTSPAAPAEERTVRWLAWAAFVAVCLQATLGGIRVTGATAGLQTLALVLRVLHGCVAQGFLVILISLAALLSPSWQSAPAEDGSRPRIFGWVAAGTIYFQLILGAVMRHLGAGLAIPTFPVASPTGSWMPTQYDPLTESNFAHTRFGAVIVSLVVLYAVVQAFRIAGAQRRIQAAAATLLALLGLQITLGVLVIWHGRPPTLTTFHVLNGAALLATSVVLALLLRRPSPALIARQPAGILTSTPAIA